MPTYSFSKQVPTPRLPSYQNLGWLMREVLPNNLVLIDKTMIVPTTEHPSEHVEPTGPTFLQRGTICRPLGQFSDAPLFEAVEMDFMGAAEYENGALIRSLRRFEAQALLYEMINDEQITAQVDGREFALKLFANFDSLQQRDEYMIDLYAMFHKASKADLLGINVKDRISLVRTDFWWDIKNDVFMSFDKQFMSRLMQHLQCTVRTLNQG